MQATGGVNGMMRRGETLLRMSDIGKSFSGVPVLSDVHFDLRSGEVHVLAGENGAGKSTLIKILAGAYGDYDGTIELSGEIVHFRSPHEATDRGIAVIYQEMSLVGSLSIVDNIFLGREPAAGGLWLDTKREIGMASELLQEVGVDVDMLQPVEEYPISIRQMIEIVKALAINASIIVMDEPTSSLNDVEVDRLFSIIGVLKARGCGIVYITHKMEEIYRIADRITVLRDGKCIGTSAASGLSQAELIRWMVGREINQQFPRRSVTPGDLRLQVDHLSVRDPSDPSRYVVHDVSFAVRAGEILGVAGLQGSGNSELLNGLFGTYGALAGATVRIDDVPFHIRSPQDSIERGVALLTNDRKTSGLVMEMEVVHNLTLASLRKFSPGGWLLPAREERAARIRSDALNLKAASLWQEAGTLSGGNQQKVVLAKWLETSPRVFLLDEPTRGVDVGVKHEIYELMNRWTESGCAIVLLTSEMPELLAMADRVLVMHRGRVASEFSRNDATQENILRAAMGGTLERPA